MVPKSYIIEFHRNCLHLYLKCYNIGAYLSRQAASFFVTHLLHQIKTSLLILFLSGNCKQTSLQITFGHTAFVYLSGSHFNAQIVIFVFYCLMVIYLVYDLGQRVYFFNVFKRKYVKDHVFPKIQI